MTADQVRPERADRLRARLVELDAIGTVLGRAADSLGAGWVQHAWVDGGGACLVAAIQSHATGQLRARALDVCWHTRYGDLPGTPGGLHRVPPPAVRLARVRDLTRWNDAPGRRGEQVVALLADARRLAGGEADRLRGILGLRPAVTAEASPAS